MQSWKFKKIKKSWQEPPAPNGHEGSCRIFKNFQLCIERFFVRSMKYQQVPHKAAYFYCPSCTAFKYMVGNKNGPSYRVCKCRSVLFWCCWIKKSFNAKLKVKKIEKFWLPRLRGPCQNFPIFEIFNFALKDLLNRLHKNSTLLVLNLTVLFNPTVLFIAPLYYRKGHFGMATWLILLYNWDIQYSSIPISEYWGKAGGYTSVSFNMIPRCYTRLASCQQSAWQIPSFLVRASDARPSTCQQITSPYQSTLVRETMYL